MSVFAFGDLPTIQTRKALLLLDFQNDFVRPSGALYIPNTPDILETLPQLASAFRRAGDVVWVRSQYESPQVISDWNFGDRIVLDREPPRRKEMPTSDIIEAGSDHDSPEPVDPEAFLSGSSPCPDPHTPDINSPHQFWPPSMPSMTPWTRFVTELYLCGSLSNVSVFATALDAVRNGFSVTLVEDCLGFRDFQRHQEAMRRMADILGAAGITAQELIQELDWDETEAIARQGAPQPKRSAATAGLESVMDGLEFWNTADNSPTEDSRDLKDPSVLELASLSRAQRATAAQARGPVEDQKKVRARVRRPKRRDAPKEPSQSAEIPNASQVNIGEGDSRLVNNVNLAADSFERIQAEVDWQKMYHLSGQVPRLVAVQGQPRPDGAIPIYRHPADESPPFKPFTPAVDEVRMADRISEHSDKTLDIVRGSFICNVSLGAERMMVLRTKASASDPEEGIEPCRTTQRVPLPHKSLFVLGPKTNMRWLHGIRADKRPNATKSAEEQAYGGQRISLTFRHIGTFIDPVANTIWGQGAVSKTLDQARAVVHGDPAETARLIGAFGQENRATEFDWDAVYGGGFDVVNFVTTSTGQLVLGCDLVANLRVRLCLGENGIRYRLVTDHEKLGASDSPKTLPVYETPDGATIAGDSVILTHMANRSAETLRPAIDRFLAHWRQHCATDSGSVFEYGMEDWESILQGQHYLGGSVFTIDDCSLWPVLREIVQTQGAFDARFVNVNQYYQRVENWGIVRSILEE
ncbi:hypothetical protein N7519_011807 [Penicillium mononematosum]|uniref:uncharacterized protein n=1 Tax=Penicillium mononematosum TaxID=268346 RepID=UPI0025472BDC|nr:uncharacterized protein N7519_011807 [Penicillium mononematosum]KAJ6181346.1 hypothetical protein N7519_011807 [Penicillium mononematosum]